MTTMLFQLLLFTGTVHSFLSASHKKYYVIQAANTWNGARAYCQATHIDLAIIENRDDLVRFQNDAQMQGFNSEAWIGLYDDIKSWHWSFENKPLVFADWSFGQPNNQNGHEECVVIGRIDWFSGTGWNDADCNSLQYVLCYDASNLGPARYISPGLQMNWYNAQTYCRQHYTDLAIITNSADNTDALKVLQGRMGLFWIGLFRDSWKWIDQTNLSTITWAPGQPDNRLQNENCGFVSNSHASDAPCTGQRSFFCYSEITGRTQTIRFMIQSKQDVSGPGAEAAILEQIKENLVKVGLAENTTLKWIEKPGGVLSRKEKLNVLENATDQSCDL